MSQINYFIIKFNKDGREKPNNNIELKNQIVSNNLILFDTRFDPIRFIKYLNC